MIEMMKLIGKNIQRTKRAGDDRSYIYGSDDYIVITRIDNIGVHYQYFDKSNKCHKGNSMFDYYLNDNFLDNNWREIKLRRLSVDTLDYSIIATDKGYTIGCQHISEEDAKKIGKFFLEE